MSYIEKAILPGERIIYAASLHWIVYVQGLFITVVGGLVGFYSYRITTLVLGENLGQNFGRPLAAGALIVVLIGITLLMGAYIRQTSTELALTNRRIIAKYGFISRTTFEIVNNRITGANFEQTFTGRLMGFGTVLVHGAGGEVSPIDNVADPQGFHKALMDVIEQAQSR